MAGEKLSMSSITEKDVLAALKEVQEPQSGKDLVSLKMVKDVQIDGPRVSLAVEFKSASYPFKEKVQANAKAAVMTISSVGIVTVNYKINDPLKVIFPNRHKSCHLHSRPCGRSNRCSRKNKI